MRFCEGLLRLEPLIAKLFYIDERGEGRDKVYSTIMLFKKEKKMNVPDLWNFMTSLNKKDKALFEELLDNDNEPLEYKGDVKQGGLLKNKKMIERRVIEKEEDGRLRDYTQYRIQPDVYEVLKPSYDQFYSIIGD